MEADNESVLSDAESINTDDAFQQEIDEAFANQQPTLDLGNPNPSPDPESTAEPPKDKGKGKEEVLFDVPAHQRPLSSEESEGIDRLNFRQVSHLVERFRPEIAAESRPGHRDEFYAEMQEEMQANFDAELAAEKAKWEAETEAAGEKTKKMERDFRASFSKGQEKGEKAAIADHATRWKSMDDQLANEKKKLQAREEKLEKEKTRLEGLQGDRTNAQTAAEVASQAKEIAALAKENERLIREGNAYVDELMGLLSGKDEEIKRGREEMESAAQQQLAEQATRHQGQLAAERQAHEEAMRAAVQGQQRRRVVDVDELTDGVSGLHLDDRDQEAAGPSRTPSNSTDQLRQELASQQSRERRSQKELARLRASNKTLRQSLGDCQAKLNQPPIDHCAARLQKLQADLEEKHGKELEEQASRMLEEASEREDRLRAAIAGLERDMEASRAALEKQTRASQEAKGTVQAFRERAKLALAERRGLEASLAEKTDELERMTTELGRVSGRLAECELVIEKEADEVRELEALVDARLEAWERWEVAAAAPPPELAVVEEAEEGEREMDAPLEVSEKASEGLFRPQFPRWGGVLFWLLVVLILVFLVVSVSAISAASWERQMRLEVTRRALIRRQWKEWQDPWLDLSRGMYGVN